MSDQKGDLQKRNKAIKARLLDIDGEIFKHNQAIKDLVDESNKLAEEKSDLMETYIDLPNDLVATPVAIGKTK